VDAVQREQEMARTLAIVEDEKATMFSQISILQDQQMALGNRLESLSQTAGNAIWSESRNLKLDWMKPWIYMHGKFPNDNSWKRIGANCGRIRHSTGGGT
jgi:hypothetical protein